MYSTSLNKPYKWHSHPNRLRQKPDWAFSMRWALATCLAGTLSWILSFAFAFITITLNPRRGEVANQVDADFYTSLSGIIVAFLLMSFTFGLFIAIAQALVLRNRRGWTGIMNGGWLVSCTLGYLFALLIPFGNQAIMTAFGGLNLCAAFVAAGIATLVLTGVQWFTLRLYIKGADMWLFANALGIMLAWSVSSLILSALVSTDRQPTYFFDWGYILVATLVISMSLLAYGLITGIALNKMERDTVAYTRMSLLSLRHRPHRPVRATH